MQVGDLRRAQGFTLVALLLALALVSLALAAAGPMWSQQQRRERERELLRIGPLVAQALQSYREASPGSARLYPLRLDDLLLDTRFVGTRRHLRAIYPDPLQPSRPWGLLTDELGRINGVFSQGIEAPIAQGAVQLDDRRLPAAQRYADWQFLALPKPDSNLRRP